MLAARAAQVKNNYMYTVMEETTKSLVNFTNRITNEHGRNKYCNIFS